MYRILCVIDSLGSGGAQRQIVNLATGLKALGQEVSLACYHPEEDFFQNELAAANIAFHPLKRGPKLFPTVPFEILKLSRRLNSNLVISFLTAPSLYCELAKLFRAYPKLIVSERHSHLDEKNPLSRILFRIPHVTANAVTANSYSQTKWLQSFFWLRRKTTTIYNGYDAPNWTLPPPINPDGLRILGIGRISPVKNLLSLIESLAILSSEYGINPKVQWAGRLASIGNDAIYWKQVESRLNRYPKVAENFVWLGETRNINQLLAESHALILPSLHEGFPNVLCEALFAGRPVLASNVCDHPRLIEENRTGFLFDPASPRSMADAIQSFGRLSRDQYQEMACRCREVAVTTFSKERYALAYLELADRLFRKSPY